MLRLSQEPQGNLADDPDPNIEHVTTIGSNRERFAIQLVRKSPANGLAIWLFSAASVSKLPQLVPVASAESKIEARLRDSWSRPYCWIQRCGNGLRSW